MDYSLNLSLSETQKLGNNEYEVEDILSKRRVKNGETQFFIKWKGYDMSEATWEPLANLKNSASLLKKFEKEYEKAPDKEKFLNQKFSKYIEKESNRIINALKNTKMDLHKNNNNNNKTLNNSMECNDNYLLLNSNKNVSKKSSSKRDSSTKCKSTKSNKETDKGLIKVNSFSNNNINNNNNKITSKNLGEFENEETEFNKDEYLDFKSKNSLEAANENKNNKVLDYEQIKKKYHNMLHSRSEIPKRIIGLQKNEGKINMLILMESGKKYMIPSKILKYYYCDMMLEFYESLIFYRA